MAQAKSNSLSKARETLVAQREEIVSGLATKYSSKSVADLISVSDAIAILDEMIRRREGQKPAAGVDIGMPVQTKA